MAYYYYNNELYYFLDDEHGAFWNDNSINEIYCYATTPPSFTNFYDSIYYYASFSSNLKEEAILYVPTRCGTKYQSSSWGTFKNIIEMD